MLIRSIRSDVYGALGAAACVPPEWMGDNDDGPPRLCKTHRIQFNSARSGPPGAATTPSRRSFRSYLIAGPVKTRYGVRDLRLRPSNGPGYKLYRALHIRHRLP